MDDRNVIRFVTMGSILTKSDYHAGSPKRKSICSNRLLLGGIRPSGPWNHGFSPGQNEGVGPSSKRLLDRPSSGFAKPYPSFLTLGERWPRENKVYPVRQNRSKRILARSAGFLLLFAVAGLTTLARRCEYLPQSNPLCHFSKVAKIEVVEQSAHFDTAPVHPIASVVAPPEPQFSAAPLEEPTCLTLRLSGLAVSFQHRAPPPSIA